MLGGVHSSRDSSVTLPWFAIGSQHSAPGCCSWSGTRTQCASVSPVTGFRLHTRPVDASWLASAAGWPRGLGHAENSEGTAVHCVSLWQGSSGQELPAQSDPRQVHWCGPTQGLCGFSNTPVMYPGHLDLVCSSADHRARWTKMQRCEQCQAQQPAAHTAADRQWALHVLCILRDFHVPANGIRRPCH